MTKLEDIAKATGVSAAVVSRVARNDPSLRVGAETRERVLKAISDLDYSPNVAAQSLRSARSGLIAVVVHDVSNPVYADFMRGAQLAAARANQALLICDAAVGADSSTQLAKLIGGRGVDGLIIQPAGGAAEAVLSRAAHRNVPTVVLQTDMGTGARLVMLPDEAAACLATRHLLELGHTEIGVIATDGGLTFTEMRLEGCRLAMSSAGLELADDSIVHAGSSIEGGLAVTGELLDRKPALTALVCLNMMSAIGALEIVGRRGLRVPEDMSLLAIHDIRLAEFLNPPMTAIRMPLFELGQEAVRLVLAPKQAVAGPVIVDAPAPELIKRRSTSAPGG